MTSPSTPIAALAVITLAFAFLTGCTVGGSDESGGSDSAATTSDRMTEADALVAQLREEPFDEGAVEVVEDVLSAAGVLVAEEWDAGESAVIRTTPWQVQNMAAEAANGGGASGADLGALAPTPEGAPPIGYLISAWALSYESESAQFARALLGDRDFTKADEIRFPDLVLTLLLADATAGIDASSVDPSALGQAGMVTVGFVTAPCTSVSNFVQNAIATVANALKVRTSGIFGFLGRIWNFAVDLAADLVSGLLDAVTRPITQAMITVFSAVETIRQVSSYLLEWRATAGAEDGTYWFGVDGQVVTGEVLLTVQDNRLPIPDLVLDCSAAFGVDLRSAGSAEGSAVVWAPLKSDPGGLAAQRSADPSLDKAQTARLVFETGQESSEQAAKGEEHHGLAHVQASIQRNDIERVRKLFAHLLLDQIPGALRPIVVPIAEPIIGAATRHLAGITDVSTGTYLDIGYHGEPPDEPEDDPDAWDSVTIPTVCPPAAVIGTDYGPERADRTTPETITCGYGSVGNQCATLLVLGAGDGAAWEEWGVALDYPGADWARVSVESTYCGSTAGIVVQSGDRFMVFDGAVTEEQVIAIADAIIATAQ